MEGNIYEMDVHKTGNEFIAYPNSADSVLQWEYDKAQNLDVVSYPTTSLELDVYLKENVNTASDVMALYTAASNEATNEQMAAFLLGLLGEVSYRNGNEVAVITAADLAEALRVSKLSNIYKDQNASPYALYIAWCTKNGIE